MEQPLFYLRSRHGNCGSNLMFHNKNGAGYGTDLDKLELFTLDEAQKELDHDIDNIPLLKSAVDAVAIRAVDHQYLKEENNIVDPNDEYLVQIKGRWNGNDIAFAKMGGFTFSYDEATVLSLIDAKDVSGADCHIWSKSYLDALCRRTFQEENISTRKMITGAGIKYKKPRKKKESSGKVRWNCPTCGKLTWQYNSYDFERCKDIFCDSY